MIELSPRSGLPAPIVVRRATSTDHVVLERLWLMFRHDMSGVSAGLPRPDGSFRSERLASALSEPDWHAWLLTIGEHPGGLAIVRAVDQPVRVLNSFVERSLLAVRWRGS